MSFFRRGAVALGFVALLAAASWGFGQDAVAFKPLGFTPKSAAAERKAEATALSTPNPERARAWLRYLTEEPHVAGTPTDLKTAEYVRDKLASWGWKAELAVHHVLLNYPVVKHDGTGKMTLPMLELVAPSRKRLSLIEAAHTEDKDSASPLAFPAFHGYGVSGDVTGQVVYANYGSPEDFDALEKLGVAVAGRIVLVRYGSLFRGLKVRNAQLRGAKGVLIYSDPADDGYARGDVYPHGPFRPGSSLQRGSVQFLSLGPGDPSTPNGASTKNAARLPFDPRNGFTLDAEGPAVMGTRPGLGGIAPGALPGGQGGLRSVGFEPQMLGGNASEQPSILSIGLWEKQTGLKRSEYFATIPSLPISYDAARPILESLGGDNVPGGWQGGLPFAYHTGPGPAEVHFAVEMDYKVRPIWNVIARITGTVEPDRWVFLGNHRDAWVYGAVDPSSGTASTMETARALGAAFKEGWKPRRTIVYTSWDGEEYGLVGSTEWADEHAQELNAKALLMLNVDSAVSGPHLNIDGVPSLRDLMLDSAAVVRDPRSGKPLSEIWLEGEKKSWAGRPVELGVRDTLWDLDAKASASTPAPVAKFAPMLSPLGSGSDYTAFLDHLAIPCLDAGFGGRYGVYHSVYDNFHWMEKFGDPEFLTHATAARLYAVVIMRAAAADVAPLTFTPYAEAMRSYVDDLRRTVASRARGAEGSAKPAFKFEGLEKLAASIRAFGAEAKALDEATTALAARDDVDPSRLERVNAALTKVERGFLMSKGLPGRPWFQHAIYAPSLVSAYASWPLPGVRQAILDNDPKMLAEQLPPLVDAINAAAATLKAARSAAETKTAPAARE